MNVGPTPRKRCVIWSRAARGVGGARAGRGVGDVRADRGVGGASSVTSIVGGIQIMTGLETQFYHYIE